MVRIQHFVSGAAKRSYILNTPHFCFWWNERERRSSRLITSFPTTSLVVWLREVHIFLSSHHSEPVSGTFSSLKLIKTAFFNRGLCVRKDVSCPDFAMFFVSQRERISQPSFSLFNHLHQVVPWHCRNQLHFSIFRLLLSSHFIVGGLYCLQFKGRPEGGHLPNSFAAMKASRLLHAYNFFIQNIVLFNRVFQPRSLPCGISSPNGVVRYKTSFIKVEYGAAEYLAVIRQRSPMGISLYCNQLFSMGSFSYSASSSG